MPEQTTIPEQLTENQDKTIVPETELNLKEPDYVDLFSGKGLKQSEVSAITNSLLTRVIVIAGGVGAGKTTILISLMHLFHNGMMKEYDFAGSRTLIAFEDLAFDSRTASERESSTTLHTKPTMDDISFLHLCVRKKQLKGPLTHLLFTDISGEDFQQARDSEAECKKLWVLRRADYFVLVLDGNNLCNKKERHSEKSSAITLLRRCIETEMIGMNTYVDIFFSKCDIINGCSPDEGINNYISEIESEFKQRFETKLGKLRFYKVAARPIKQRDLGEGYGFNLFFPSWVEDSPFITIPKRMENIVIDSSSRMISKLK